MVRGFVVVKRFCGDRMKVKVVGLRSWELLVGFLYIDDLYQMVVGILWLVGFYFSGRKDKKVKFIVFIWKVCMKFDNKVRLER